MYHTFKLTALVILIGFILMGCATTKMVREIPTYSQDQEVYLGEDLKLKIQDAYWTDQINFQKADAKFLVINLSITNIGKKTTTIKPPVFTLLHEQGYEYEISYRGIAGGGPSDNFIEKLAVDRLSPLIPVRGKVVFDVPKGNYVMIVSEGEKRDKGLFYRGKDLYKYRLSPQER
jgi:hypothetical protein